MNREELIKELMQHELNQFRFSVWATYNDDGSLKFALCLLGEKPYGYDIHFINIGGLSCVNYNYDFVEFCIDDAIDEFYLRKF